MVFPRDFCVSSTSLPVAGASSALPGGAGEHHLQRQLGTGARARRFYRDQVLDHLNPAMVDFVGRQRLMFLATSGADGSCDSTLRAGPPGFLQVLDDRTVTWPELRGNGVMASLGNVTENPNVGLLLVDFFDDVIGLHINGHAQIVDAEDARRDGRVHDVELAPGRRPSVWVEVAVEEAYVHCSKNIPHLSWRPDDLRLAGVRRKGGDYFRSIDTDSPWAGAACSDDGQAV